MHKRQQDVYENANAARASSYIAHFESKTETWCRGCSSLSSRIEIGLNKESEKAAFVFSGSVT